MSTLEEALRSVPKGEVPTRIAPPVNEPRDDAFATEGFRFHGRTGFDKIRLPVLGMQIIDELDDPDGVILLVSSLRTPAFPASGSCRRN